MKPICLLLTIALIGCAKESQPTFDKGIGEAYTELRKMRPEMRPQMDALPLYTAFRCNYQGNEHLHPLINAIDVSGYVWQNFPAFLGSGYDVDGSGGVGWADTNQLLDELGKEPNHNMQVLNVTPNMVFSTQIICTINQDLIIDGVQVYAEGDLVFLSKSMGDETEATQDENWWTVGLVLPNGKFIYYAIQL